MKTAVEVGVGVERRICEGENQSGRSSNQVFMDEERPVNGAIESLIGLNYICIYTLIDMS